MKKMLVAIAAFITIIFASCNKNAYETAPAKLPTLESLQFDESLLTIVRINANTAHAMISAWQNYIDTYMPSSMSGSKYFYMDKDILNNMLSNPSVKHLMVYPALKENGKMTLVYVGADKNESGEYVELPYTFGTDPTEYVMDNVVPCPVCPKSNISSAQINIKMDNSKMSVEEATDIISNWHAYVDDHMPDAMLNSLYFVMDADVLRDVLSDTEALGLMVYPSLRPDSTMTLIYAGATDDSQQNLTGMTYTFTNDDTEYMLDNVVPCPVCPKVSELPDGTE